MEEKKVKISVVSPSVRPEMLPIVSKCLSRQSFQSFEWIIVCPQDLMIPIDRQIGHENQKYSITVEPPKREGDYYNLNKAWNAAFKQCGGELIVSIVDGLWFPPDTLQKLRDDYENDKLAVVGGIGHQYDQIVNGKPEHEVWHDPRQRIDQGGYYEINPWDQEWCLTSIPAKALFAIGGMDEEYDKGCALSEKDANNRMFQLGYRFYLDQSLEYRAIHHPRLDSRWDEMYKITTAMYTKHAREVVEGKRLKLNYL